MLGHPDTVSYRKQNTNTYRIHNLGSLVRPLFYFLCSDLKANPVQHKGLQNSQKTFYKTIFTTCRPRLYITPKCTFSADATDPHFDGCDEHLFGRAGYVCGALWIRKQLGTHGLGSDLVKLEDVRRYFKIHKIHSTMFEGVFLAVFAKS